jgi:hypothetical protein
VKHEVQTPATMLVIGLLAGLALAWALAQMVDPPAAGMPFG